MSKRAGAVSAETREWIIKAAKEEFSSYGFQGSSLRRICSAAGVTTGALYFFFQGKDDLFQTVLSQVTEPFLRLMDEHYKEERGSSGHETEAGASADFQVSEQLIDLYFNNQQTWDILVNHLNHPAVRSFLDRFIENSAAHYQYLLEGVQIGPGQPVDPFAIHQFVHMQVDAILTLISHNFSQEEMVQHSRTVVRMLRGAFRALLED